MSGSKFIFQRLLHAGVEPHPTEGDGATPLHYIRADASLELVQLLKSLYGDGCRLRFDGRLPVELYLRQCLVQRDTNEPNVDIIRELICQDSSQTKRHELRTLWEYVTSTLLREAKHISLSEHRRHGDHFASAITCLMQLGVVDSYEAETQDCGLFSLLGLSDQGFDTLDALRPLSSPNFYRIVEQTQHWVKARDSPVVSQLLKAAIASADLPLVKLLVEKGVNVQTRTGGISPIEKACQTGLDSHDLFRLLLDHADNSRLDELNPDGDALGLIHYLGKSKSARMTEELLKRGADPNLRMGVYPYSPALVQHLMSSSFESAKALLGHGADPIQACHAGFDAALAAAANGATLFLSELSLLKTHSEKQIWQKTCRTGIMEGRGVEKADINALHVASWGGHGDCLRFYMDHGFLVDVNSTSAGLWTPMHFAAFGGHVDTIKLLHSMGAYISPRAADGSLPLHVAIKSGRLGAVETLLELKSEHTLNSDGMSPLMVACILGDQPIVNCLRQALRSEDNRPHQTDVYGDTMEHSNAVARSLGIAITKGALGVCKDLYRQGCSLDLSIPPCGCSPLVLAIWYCRHEIIEWFLKRGALTTQAACQRHGNFTAVGLMLQRKVLNSLLPELLQKYLTDGGRCFNRPNNVLSGAIVAGNTKGLQILLNHMKENIQGYA
jgi:ankyrin repeat protein